jgi:cobalt-zinc-cadmium efflux system outer membrane protein
MRLCFTGLPVLAAFIVTASAPFAESVTVDALVRRAMTGNPALQMAEAEVAAARGERVSAGSWRNPEISAEIGAKEARDSEDILQGTGITFGVQLSQTFEWPGKGTLRKAIADRNVSLAELALDQFRKALEARIRGLAAELAAINEKSRLSGDAAREGEHLIRALARRPRAGIQQLIEVRLIEAAMIDLRKATLDLETSAAALRTELNQLCGFPASSSLQIDRSPVNAAPPGDLKRLLFAGGGNHPQVRLRALEMENAGLRLRQARLSGAPDVAIGPFLNREEAGDVETTIGAVISMPLPLWDRGRGEIDQARARSALSAAALALAQREAEAEITRLHREWDSASRLLAELSAERVNEFHEAAGLASRQFRSGAISVQLYLDMQRESLAVAATREDALAAALRSAAALEALTAPPVAIPISSKSSTNAPTRKKP